MYRGEITRRFREVFGPCRFLVTLRNQIDCVGSTYLQTTRDFERKLSACPTTKVWMLI